MRLATKEDVTELARALGDAPRIALDTEFHAERRYTPALFLVQIKVPDAGVWIVDPLERGLLSEIREPLLGVPWVVHGGRWDMEVMQVALGGLPEEILDTQIGAGLVAPWFPAAYSELVVDYLGLTLPKTATMSDWSRRPLSQDQLTYAAEDVELLLPLWDSIQERLDGLERSDIARAACHDARSAVVEPASPDEAWRSIGARSVLDGRQLSVLKEIARWRREQAVLRNQPERSVLSDGSLVELARRQPTTPEALAKNRRLPKSLQKNPNGLMELITRAAARPEWAWPVAVKRRTPRWAAIQWLEVWAAALGQRDFFAGGLVFPRLLLEDVALLEDVSQLEGLLGAWRWSLCGPALQEALTGDATLSLADGTVCVGASSSRC